MTTWVATFAEFQELYPVAKYYKILRGMVAEAYLWKNDTELHNQAMKICKWCGNDEKTKLRLEDTLRYLRRAMCLPQVVRPSDPILNQPYDIKL